MNPEKPKDGPRGKWLIFSYFFNIDAKASSQHIDDRVPALESLGVTPLVLSSICGERRKGLAHTRVPSAAPSGLRFELRYIKRRNRLSKLAAVPLTIAVLPFYLIEKAVINLESEWSWFLTAFLRGLLLCRKHRPELIYSTGGPASAHLAAGLVARRTGLPWIAELQDPIVFKDWSRSKTALKIHSWLERFIMENASEVVFLTDGAMERTMERTPERRAATRVIYPGASPADDLLAGCRRGEFCRFAHFGSLGGTRNPGTFLDALQALLDADPGLGTKVRIDLYGTMDGLSARQIAAFKYPEIVTDFGKVSRREALGAMRKSDVLLLIQNMDDISYETIPSKVYEYFQAKRPILGLVYRNPPLSRMLTEQGHFAAEADSPAEITAGIVKTLDLWRTEEGDRPILPDSPYTVQNAAKKLLAAACATLATPLSRAKSR